MVYITGTMPWHRRTTRKQFRGAFVRPEKFFFECCDVGVGPESEWKRGVIWTDAAGIHTWDTGSMTSRKVDSIGRAVGALAGISPLTYSFASKLLLSDLEAHSPLPDPLTARWIGNEDVDGVACHRIEGVRFGNQKVTIWVECRSLLVRRLDFATEFDEEKLRAQAQQVRDYVASLPADHPNRTTLEKGIAMRAMQPAQSFRTEATVRRRAVMNVDIDESVFAFTPPV